MGSMQVKAVVGDDLASQAKNGAKQFDVKANDQQLTELFGSHCFCKGLRYGACLSLCDVSAYQTSSSASILLERQHREEALTSMSQAYKVLSDRVELHRLAESYIIVRPKASQPS